MLSTALVAALTLTSPNPLAHEHRPLSLGPALTFGIATSPSLIATDARLNVVPVVPEFRAPMLAGSQIPTLRLAQQQPNTNTGTATAGAAAPPTATATPAPAPAPPPPEKEPSIDLLRQRAALTRIHRPLGIATVASLGVTLVFGTISAVNNRTLAGPGACATQCIGGNFAPNFTTIHQISSFITTGLYVSTAIFAAAMPDPENISAAGGARATKLAVHRVFRAIHLTGMILQPLLGIIAAHPGVVGVSFDQANPIESAQRIQDFQAAMRTVHIAVGYTTFAALTGGMIVELL